jgi:hypothetical protein
MILSLTDPLPIWEPEAPKAVPKADFMQLIIVVFELPALNATFRDIQIPHN